MNSHTRLKEIQSILQKIDQPLEIHIRESLEIERRGILLGLESHGEYVHRDEAAKTCHDAFESGKQQMKDILKEQGYWTEGEGTEQIYYRVEDIRYPHDLGCEGSMCYCMSRRKKEK